MQAAAAVGDRVLNVELLNKKEIKLPAESPKLGPLKKQIENQIVDVVTSRFALPNAQVLLVDPRRHGTRVVAVWIGPIRHHSLNKCPTRYQEAVQ